MSTVISNADLTLDERTLRAQLATSLDSTLARHKQPAGILITYDPGTDRICVAAARLTSPGLRRLLEVALANAHEFDDAANDVRFQ